MFAWRERLCNLFLHVPPFSTMGHVQIPLPPWHPASSTPHTNSNSVFISFSCLLCHYKACPPAGPGIIFCLSFTSQPTATAPLCPALGRTQTSRILYSELKIIYVFICFFGYCVKILNVALESNNIINSGLNETTKFLNTSKT